MHDWVVRLCVDQNVPVAHSSWNRVKMVLTDVTGKSPRLIRRETWIVKELDFST